MASSGDPAYAAPRGLADTSPVSAPCGTAAPCPLPAGWRVELVGQDTRRSALALLLTGRLRGAEPAVDQFLDFTARHGMSLDRFWLLRDDHAAPAGAALVVAAAGRAGMLFLSPLLRDGDIPSVAALVAHACQPSHVADLALVQMLLDPHQQREQQAVALAGFTPLARLQYMRRRTEKHPAPLALPDGLEMLHWSDAHRPLFADAILQSYQHTLDCPGLLGLRHIDDIIAGHMSAGQFIPELWHVIHHQGKPAGVMLLNPLPSRDAMELVYLGLSPAWRGKGLARLLVRHALGLAWAHDTDEMLLAVDENNTPALKLYQSLRFTPTARKLAMLRAVMNQAS